VQKHVLTSILEGMGNETEGKFVQLVQGPRGSWGNSTYQPTVMRWGYVSTPKCARIPKKWYRMCHFGGQPEDHFGNTIYAEILSARIGRCINRQLVFM